MPRFWNVPGCGLTFTLHTLDIMTDSGFLSTKSVFNYKEINIILNNPMVVSLATNYCVWIHTKVRLLYMAYHINMNYSWIQFSIVRTVYMIAMATCWPVGLFLLFAHNAIPKSLCRAVKASNFWNAFRVYAVECVSKIKSIPAIFFYSIYGAVCLQLTQFSCRDRDYVYFILLSSSSSNR